MIYDLIIIGAGPAGISAALNAPKTSKVLILEKMHEPLIKLMVSGSGACNFTHSGTTSDFLDNFGKKGKNFLRTAIYNYTNEDCVNYFKDLKIDVICNENGKYFPKSMKARDIKNALLNSLGSNVTLKTNCKVIDVQNDNSLFEISTPESKFKSKNLVISTGGKSYPKTGSDGDGYNLAKKLGHNIQETAPALAAIYCDNHNLDQFSGTSFKNIQLSLFRDNKKIDAFSGDILITHKGFSGPGIMDNSHKISKGDILKINFTNESSDTIFNKIKNSENFDVTKRFKNHFYDEFNIKNVKETSHKVLRKLALSFTEYEVKVSDIESFNTCMATSGGVSLKEISPKTMQSKIVPSLFFAGEVIDYVGQTGGYNIQAAFSTGKLSAKNLNY